MKFLPDSCVSDEGKNYAGYKIFSQPFCRCMYWLVFYMDTLCIYGVILSVFTKFAEKRLNSQLLCASRMGKNGTDDIFPEYLFTFPWGKDLTDTCICLKYKTEVIIGIIKCQECDNSAIIECQECVKSVIIECQECPSLQGGVEPTSVKGRNGRL